MPNKRILNFRPIFFLFIVLMTCIFIFVRINLSFYYLFLLVVPILFLGVLIYKKKFVFLSFSIILLVFTSLYSYFYVADYSNKSYEGQFAVVNADIVKKNKINENFYYLTLSNCKVTTENEANATLEGKLSLAFSVYTDAVEFNEGDKIVFASTLSCENFFNEQGDVNSFKVKDNIKYSAKVTYSSDVAFYAQDKNLLAKFKEYNQNLLVENFGETHGNLAFALLYGDRQDTEEQILEIFKYSGVVHVFSVSGLHVSLIVALLYFLLSKTPLNKYFKFAITFAFLILYCMLCSFSAPVVRSSIMSLVVLFAKLYYRKPDAANTFSVAGIILLMLNPMNLFDGGFQMSFVAVFGIIFFSTLFNKIKIKNKLLKSFVMFVAVSLSTTLAMLPILAKYYGVVATWSIISNLFTLPLFSIFYPLLFIINLIALVFPFLAFLYVLPKVLLVILIYLNQLVVILPYGIIKIKRFGLFATIVYFSCMFCASKYLMIKPLNKLIVCLSLLVISLTSWYIFSLPKINNQNAIVLCSEELSSASVLATKDNKFYLVNPEVNSLYNLKKWLVSQKIDTIEATIISNTQTFEAKNLYLFLQEFNSNTVYLPKGHISLNNLEQLGLNCIGIEENSNIGEFEIEYFYIDNQIVSSIIKSPQFCFATLDCNNLLQSEVNNIIANYLSLEIDVAKIYNNKNSYNITMQNVDNIIFDLTSNLHFSF